MYISLHLNTVPCEASQAPPFAFSSDELGLFDFGRGAVAVALRHPLRNRLESLIHFGAQGHGLIGGTEIVRNRARSKRPPSSRIREYLPPRLTLNVTVRGSQGPNFAHSGKPDDKARKLP